MAKAQPLQIYEVPAAVAEEMATAVKAWRRAATLLEDSLATVSQERRVQLLQVVRVLNKQALILEQVVIASPA